MQGARADSQTQAAEFWQVHPSLAYPPQPGKVVNVVGPDLDGLQAGEANQGPQKFSQVGDLACAGHFNDQLPAQARPLSDFRYRMVAPRLKRWKRNFGMCHFCCIEIYLALTSQGPASLHFLGLIT